MVKRTILLLAACTLMPATHALPELPALRDNATEVRHPGRLIWADLFTADVDEEVAFYSQLFGWESRRLEDTQLRYTLLLNRGQPIAGVVFRPASERATARGVWMPYLSASNLEETLQQVTAAGGKVEVPAREFPRRGSQAIVRDSEGALLGLMQSSNGDPDDGPAEIGSFFWAQLYVRDLDSAIRFYDRALGFKAESGTGDDAAYAYLFKSGEDFRASLSKLPDDHPDAAPGWLGCIRVADIPATLAKVESLGGSVIWGPEPEVMDGRIAVIADPAEAALIVVDLEEEDAVNHE